MTEIAERSRNMMKRIFLSAPVSPVSRSYQIIAPSSTDCDEFNYRRRGGYSGRVLRSMYSRLFAGGKQQSRSGEFPRLRRRGPRRGIPKEDERECLYSFRHPLVIALKLQVCDERLPARTNLDFRLSRAFSVCATSGSSEYVARRREEERDRRTQRKIGLSKPVGKAPGKIARDTAREASVSQQAAVVAETRARKVDLYRPCVSRSSPKLIR